MPRAVHQRWDEKDRKKALQYTPSRILWILQKAAGTSEPRSRF